MVRHILLFFGPVKVAVASAYRQPIEWNNLPDYDLFLQNPALDEAMEIVYSREWICVGLSLDCKQWWKRMGACARTIPADLSEGYVPANVYVQFGPASISSPLGESMAARCSFQLALGGDGMPKDLNRYLDLISNTVEIIALRKHLNDVTGKDWRLLITATF